MFAMFSILQSADSTAARHRYGLQDKMRMEHYCKQKISCNTVGLLGVKRFLLRVMFNSCLARGAHEVPGEMCR